MAIAMWDKINFNIKIVIGDRKMFHNDNTVNLSGRYINYKQSSKIYEVKTDRNEGNRQTILIGDFIPHFQ